MLNEKIFTLLLKCRRSTLILRKAEANLPSRVTALENETRRRAVLVGVRQFLDSHHVHIKMFFEFRVLSLSRLLSAAEHVTEECRASPGLSELSGRKCLGRRTPSQPSMSIAAVLLWSWFPLGKRSCGWSAQQSSAGKFSCIQDHGNAFEGVRISPSKVAAHNELTSDHLHRIVHGGEHRGRALSRISP